MCKSLIKTKWSYGIERWAAIILSINKIKNFQFKTLRRFLNVFPYTSNETIHTYISSQLIK